ncbi:hypothetical protein AJ79_09474, partial [Helicocarpus griseus UAMH5409]
LESPPEGLVEGLDQIIKACEYGMVNATIMKKQYQDIFAANEKEKQKCKRSRRQIQHDRGLTREEAQSLTITPAEPVELSAIQCTEPPPPGSTSRSRAPPRCSNCGSHGHRRTRCPNPSVWLSVDNLIYLLYGDFGDRFGRVIGSGVDYVTLRDAGLRKHAGSLAKANRGF